MKNRLMVSITIPLLLFTMAPVPGMAISICQKPAPHEYNGLVKEHTSSPNMFVISQSCTVYQRPKRSLKNVHPVAVRISSEKMVSPTIASKKSEPPDKKMITPVYGKNITILFDFNSAIVPADNKPKLLAFAAMVNEISRAGHNPRIIIEGFTCNLGSVEYNKALALKRANAVSSFLADKGIRPFAVIGKGVTLNGRKHHNRQLDRRVEIKLEKGE